MGRWADPAPSVDFSRSLRSFCDAFADSFSNSHLDSLSNQHTCSLFDAFCDSYKDFDPYASSYGNPFKHSCACSRARSANKLYAVPDSDTYFYSFCNSDVYPTTYGKTLYSSYDASSITVTLAAAGG